MSREPEIMESQVMWEPDTKRNTHMDRFRAAVASSCGLRLGELRGDSRGCAGARAGCEAHPWAHQLSVPVGTELRAGCSA